MSRKKYIYSPIIYKTTNLINSMIYVGQHKTSADDGYLGSGTYFKSIVKEFGKENFIRETLEYCEKSELNNKERYWIAELSAKNPEMGYNKTIGGQFGWIGEDNPNFGKPRLDETKRKISVANSGKNNPNFGKPTSEETKRKISESQIGKIISDKTKQKMSENHADINGKNNPNFGKPKSEETKRKQSDSMRGKLSGEKNPKNKYKYFCSNDKNYWNDEDFTRNEKIGICQTFRRKKLDTITYKNITITRISKNV